MTEKLDIVELGEPLARSKAAHFKVWKPTSSKAERLSYAFIAPIMSGTGSQKSPFGWVVLRFRITGEVHDLEPQGRGWRYRSQVLLLDQSTLTPISVIYDVLSEKAWSRIRCAIRCGAADSMILMRRLQYNGVSSKLAKLHMKTWIEGDEEELND